jgi:hypothetical protein
MPRYKAPEILRSEAYMESTPQRRRIRETQQMGVFQQAAKERRGVEGEQVVAPPEIMVSRDQEGRKVRAPQGRVVRNTDCPRSPQGRFRE